MSPTLLALYVALTRDSATLHCTRAKNGNLVALQVSAECPADLPKGHTFGLFTPTEVEGQFIDLVTPKAAPKVDPMADRLRKSSVERPVQYVLRQVRENPDMDRKALIALCVSQGVADYTARTQVQVGLKRRAEQKALAEKNMAEQKAMEEQAQAEQAGE